MSDVYLCNWADCLETGKRKEMIWHVTKVHIREEQVPYYCTLCKFRSRSEGALQRHCKSYKPHVEMMANHSPEEEQTFLVVSSNPYFVNLGTDTIKCDAIRQNNMEERLNLELYVDSSEFIYVDQSCQTDDTYRSNQELKAEMNIMKGTQKVELNRFADFISRKETELSKREDEVKALSIQMRQKDDQIRILERQNRHKDTEIETLRRKLRIQEQEFTKRRAFTLIQAESEKENESPCPKKIKSVIKKLF